jgi:hypothetical protein
LVGSGPAICLSAALRFAADKTWKNSGTDFNTNGSWNSTGAPGTSDRAVFSGAMLTGTTSAIDAENTSGTNTFINGSLASGKINLSVTALPEPSTYVSGILGFLVIASTQIKRRHRKRRFRLPLQF